ncbi:MAG: ATP-binding protein [Campylobacterales bacterium]
MITKDTNKNSLLKNQKAIFELCFDLAFITDKDNNIMEINTKASEFLGIKEDELKNQNITKLLDSKKNTIKDIDGKEYSVEIKTTTIDYDNEAFRVYNIRDITEKLQMIKDQEEQEALLIQQSKTASMGEMIGVIAHQWKQPINTVSLIIQQLGVMVENDKDIDKNKLIEIESLVMGHIEFMSQTITDFREFFKPSKKKSFFNISDAIREISRLMSFKLRKMGIDIEIDNRENFTIYGYPNELKHLILNLINNAKDSIAESRISDGKVKITIDRDGQKGMIYIEDNGGGIPEELLPNKIFEPYFTTKDDNGTGIGLSISKMIIQKHLNGDIKACNNKYGATFAISLDIKND